MLQGKVECIIGLQLQLLDCPSGLSQYALACLWLKMIQLPREKGVPDCCVTVHDLARFRGWWQSLHLQWRILNSTRLLRPVR